MIISALGASTSSPVSLASEVPCLALREALRDIEPISGAKYTEPLVSFRTQPNGSAGQRQEGYIQSTETGILPWGTASLLVCRYSHYAFRTHRLGDGRRRCRVPAVRNDESHLVLSCSSLARAYKEERKKERKKEVDRQIGRQANTSMAWVWMGMGERTHEEGVRPRLVGTVERLSCLPTQKDGEITRWSHSGLKAQRFTINYCTTGISSRS